jgi:GTPase SAR1 family protein
MNSELQFELNSLLVNFSKVDAATGKAFRSFEPPTATEICDDADSEQIQAKIVEMLSGDAATRFYAAVILNKIDQPRSQQILDELKNDNSIISVQTQLGHGVLEVPAYILARGFESEGKVWSSDVRKIENLSRWALAVRHEAQQNSGGAEVSLPTYADALAAQGDGEKRQRLNADIEKLLTQSAAHKFYAAALLENIDEAERQRILHSLKNDNTPVVILFGDISQAVPASEAAGAILENRAVNIQNSKEFKNLDTTADKFFRWLNSSFFKK